MANMIEVEKSESPACDERLVMLPPSALRTDGDTQARADRDDKAVHDYGATYRQAKDELPPLRAVQDGTNYWLWDGFHRLEGAKEAGVEELPVLVSKGTQDDARWLACGANKENQAIRRTNEDKRHAVKMALSLNQSWSDGAIADHCGVSDRLVARVRRELPTPNGSESDDVRLDRNGRAMKVSNIGRGGRAASNAASATEPARPKGLVEGDEEPADELSRAADAAKRRKLQYERESQKREKAPMFDKDNNPVPDPLRDLFASAGELAELADEVDKLAGPIKAAADALDEQLRPQIRELTCRGKRLGSCYATFLSELFRSQIDRVLRRLRESAEQCESFLEEAARTARNGIPATVCDACKGSCKNGVEVCTPCFGRGWRTHGRNTDLRLEKEIF
jgi:ParB-like chromosome segregation protein Spo0J